jgi:hypothetical protein
MLERCQTAPQTPHVSALSKVDCVLVFTGEVCKQGLSSSASSRERKGRQEKISSTPSRILLSIYAAASRRGGGGGGGGGVFCGVACCYAASDSCYQLSSASNADVNKEGSVVVLHYSQLMVQYCSDSAPFLYVPLLK